MIDDTTWHGTGFNGHGLALGFPGHISIAFGFWVLKSA